MFYSDHPTLRIRIMTTIDGILILNASDGSLIYDVAVKKHYGLHATLGGNELQLCAMLYTLHMSSASVHEEEPVTDVEADEGSPFELRWVKSVRSQPNQTADLVDVNAAYGLMMLTVGRFRPLFCKEGWYSGRDCKLCGEHRGRGR